MKKGGFLRNVLDTIRSNQANQSAGGPGSSSGNNAYNREFGGQLKPQHFSLAQVARHGFPENPTALAFDPVQKIAAIGTKTGALRVFGRPGVDVWVQHKPEFAVTHIKFVINQGAIITVTADESIHLWSLRGPQLKLQYSQNSSPSTSSSPAAASGSAQQTISSHSPAPQQTAASGSSNISSSNSATLTHQHTAKQLQHLDSGAQPGDPDYLADQFSSSNSPTSDKSKQYSRQPEILHTLKFQREHITCLHQTLMSKWLYIGTERGNVHVANVETFELSGYSIAWNKAIELNRKTHPGSIIHISECPQDANKLLIGYESGCIVLWDLKGRNAEGRYYHAENLLWLSWHYEGKQFVAAHGDGSLVTWQTRSNARPANILHPHAKTPTQSSSGGGANEPGDNLLNFQQQSSSFVARALNNELYRPINKVDWKTSRNNEQFLLFSGGLPYDGLDGFPSSATNSMQQQQQQSSRAASVQPSGSGQPSAQQFLKASSVSHNPSPISPSISPANPLAASATNDPATMAAGANKNTSNSSRQQQQQQQQLQAILMKERKSLRSTSLTVMYGKSITVLEMDDTIIDFITICDNSPYENDISDPLAVIILLSNDLILIDLTSSGYPSFDSPYPSANLNESPVTCVQYLADCSSDLIPFLYSTSQNVVSRVPKKGFSDKEWPINGGEWGQQMQSYPELVLTGHADGTIKFWDMSGVNFDLISKIKTSKFFERPNKLRNSTIMAHSQALAAMNSSTSSNSSSRNGGNATLNAAIAVRASSVTSPRPPIAGTGAIDQSMGPINMSENYESQMGETSAIGGITPLEESPFAIEKIEYYPSTKHLIVAGALSQVIQFRINKKESQTSGGYPVSGGGGGSTGNSSTAAAQETTTILIDPTHSDSINQPAAMVDHQRQQQQPQKHLVLKAKNPLASGGGSGATGSSSGGSSSSSGGSAAMRTRSSGFQAELICLTPSFLVPIGASSDDQVITANSGVAAAGSSSTSAPGSVARQSGSFYCVAPPKVTALALQAAHNILAYAHENGIVLVDIIQKCVIISASLSDLYGGASMMQSNRDISIQPFATSSILQHHYQSTVGSPSDFVTANSSGLGGSSNISADNGPPGGNSRGGAATDTEQQTATTAKLDNENGITNNGSSNNGAFNKSALGNSSNESTTNQPAKTTNGSNSSSTSSTTTVEDNNDDDDDDDNNNGQVSQASELGSAEHVKEAAAGELTLPVEVKIEEQQQQLTTSESRNSKATRGPVADRSESCTTTTTATTMMMTTSIANASESTTINAATAAVEASGTANKCSGSSSSSNNNSSRPRVRLLQAKSVSEGCSSQQHHHHLSCVESNKVSGRPHDWQPVAPPRARKRQSVPFARVPGELVSRHNVALAEIAAAAETAQMEAAEMVEEVAAAAAATTTAETSSSHPVDPVASKVASSTVVENDNEKKPTCASTMTTTTSTIAKAEIDNRCVPSFALATAPISSKPHEAASTTVSPMLSSSSVVAPSAKATATTTAKAATMDHRSAPSAGSVAASTISSIFTKLMEQQQQQRLPKSRFTANSAFQRQLSTTALLSEHTTGLAATTDRIGSKGVLSSGQPRLFQRQMTASQLFNHSSQTPSSPNNSANTPTQAIEALTNKQRAAALLASARANNPEMVSSTSCLSGATTTSPSSSSSSGFMSSAGSQRPSTATTASESASTAGAKKAGKKRIISRMLSISAIHTTPSLSTLTTSTNPGEQSASGSGGGGGGVTPVVAAATGANYSSTGGNYGSGCGNGTTVGPTTMTSFSDQVPDKIDSSFTRSRSSSTSSSVQTAANAACDSQQQQQQQQQSAMGESVQCLCFLDWSQAMLASNSGGLMAAPSSSSSSSSSNATNSAGSMANTTTTAAVAPNTGGVTAATAMSSSSSSSNNNNNGSAANSPPRSMLASAASNNKSLGSPPIAMGIDNSTTGGGQLALWLGTSQGSVLLVHLQMPDNEDNRVLQLQSVNAEPIPQASIKLPGAILCLAPFTCELQSVGPSSGAGGQITSHHHQTSLNSSSSGAGVPSGASSMSMDLGDTTPLGSGSMAQISGQSSLANVAPSHHHQHPSNCSPHSSFDSRSSLFLAIISEKQANIYQIPSQLKANQQQQQHSHKHGGIGSHSGHQQKHGMAIGSSQQSMVESSPLGKLLTNKTNCISKMDMSDSSYACRSQLVHMRQPDEICLVSYLATGTIMVHSLPQLRLLMEADFVPHSNQRIGSSMCFSRNGHCLYQPSRGEISKFTVAGQYCSLVNEMTGLLYVARDMPEAPRANFFKSLFSVASSSVASKQSDRDELFAGCSAGPRGVAKHFSSTGAGGSTAGGAASLEKLRGAAIGTMGHDLRVAREGLDERGEKLGEIEDKTLQMMNQSESYAQAAHQLAQKFKDKKWYQF